MANPNVNPALKLGFGGAVIAIVVVWLAGIATGTDLLGDQAPMFGPLPASGVLVILMGIVGAVVGAYRKPKQ
jgi:hypothetical protein